MFTRITLAKYIGEMNSSNDGTIDSKEIKQMCCPSTGNFEDDNYWATIIRRYQETSVGVQGSDYISQIMVGLDPLTISKRGLFIFTRSYMCNFSIRSL